MIERRVIGSQGTAPAIDRLVIDATYIAHRSLHSMEFQGGVQGAEILHFGIKTLYRLCATYHPSKVALCWDSGASWRKELYPQYKEGRPQTEPNIRHAFRTFEKVCELLGFTSVRSKHFEADDWVACLAMSHKKSYGKLAVVSGDKDMYQLISPDYHEDRGEVVVIRPGTDGDTRVDYALAEKTFVAPGDVSTYKSLCGDSSDNIPGVRSVGDVTARKIIDFLGSYPRWKEVSTGKASLDELLIHYKFKRPLVTLIVNNLELIELFYNITDLRRDHSPDKYDLFDCILSEQDADIETATRLVEEFALVQVVPLLASLSEWGVKTRWGLMDWIK